MRITDIPTINSLCFLTCLKCFACIIFYDFFYQSMIDFFNWPSYNNKHENCVTNTYHIQMTVVYISHLFVWIFMSRCIGKYLMITQRTKNYFTCSKGHSSIFLLIVEFENLWGVSVCVETYMCSLAWHGTFNILLIKAKTRVRTLRLCANNREK